MENNPLKIIWLKQCIKDFKNLSEGEFIFVNSKLRSLLSNLYQNTSSVKGTNLRRLRIGNRRLFLGIKEGKVYCVGYKKRDHAYNQEQLREMDRIIKNIF